LAVSGGSADKVDMFDKAANEGEELCRPCLLKKCEEGE